MRIYSHICIPYHIFRIYCFICPYILLKYFNLTYDVTPTISNDVYLTLYGLLWPCRTQYNILFHSTTFLYLLVRMFVLYLLRGCLITNKLLLSFYDYWFQGINIHILLFLISLLFDFFNALFDWDEYHDKVFKLFTDTYLCSLGNEVSHHFISGAPLNIQFFFTVALIDKT